MNKMWIILLYTLCIHAAHFSSIDGDMNILQGLKSEPIINKDICNEYPELNERQRSICERYPDATASAMQGIAMAIHECRRQFEEHRWNCSNLDARIVNNHPMLQRGYKEMAFMHAMTAASVLHQVATACSLGKIAGCGCKGEKTLDANGNFQWSGCNIELGWGSKYSRRFLQNKLLHVDSTQHIMHNHNSKLGRKAVIDQKMTKCKCHGMSSSCEIKTCWLAAPDLQTVGDKLKHLYTQSVKVERTQTVLANSIKENLRERKRKEKLRTSIKSVQASNPEEIVTSLKKSFIHLENSPTFCDPMRDLNITGTRGRLCNNNSTVVTPDSCSSLCCGRGFFTVKLRRVEKCDCQFHWCCYVVCKKCIHDEWVTVCK